VRAAVLLTQRTVQSRGLAREAQRLQLQSHIAEIQAEQKERNAALHKIDHSQIPSERIAERYAGGIRRNAANSSTRSEEKASNN
jgi:hypothetical protein